MAITLRNGHDLWFFAIPAAISVVFGAIVWSLRAATPGGIAAGTLICFVLIEPRPAAATGAPQTSYAGLIALIVLFLLSFAATRFGRSRKEARGLAEGRRGRQASQIVANLGAAALFAAAGSPVGCIAALAEAAADTNSSEIGQALGGPVRMITTWQTVPPGTDGGITIRGTMAGILAAIVVAALSTIGHTTWHQRIIICLAAWLGLFFDSLLGATVERKGWLGNDLVNFLSTVAAALIAVALS
ncbi:MAG: DUF92 domain-containing protein [Edaphobacter sp.]|uniref:DUF92 domain-containing protein n=1 Tax=Edaphobacter sp. TaxID=1934404 RepID=UPI00239F31D8|nr:DUF92 domain-containing protein [Edaphobacter sp.]MDE1175433.1 DUF92 domain-containing protein [Edaphobacter sp.]